MLYYRAMESRLWLLMKQYKSLSSIDTMLSFFDFLDEG